VSAKQPLCNLEVGYHVDSEAMQYLAKGAAEILYRVIKIVVNRKERPGSVL
jgi:hypothetical protein